MITTVALRQRADGLGLRSVGGSFLARGASIAASFAFAALVARQLGPEAAGQFFVLFAVFTGAATLGRFGTDNMAIKRIAGLRQGGGPESRRLLQVCAATACVAAVLMGLIGAALLRETLSGGQLVAGSALLGAGVLPASLSVTASAILRARGRVATGTLAELGSTPLLGFVALLGFDAAADPGVLPCLVIFSLANLATSVWALPAALVATRTTQTGVEGVRDLPPQATGALASMMGTSLLFYLLTWAPVLTLGLFSSHAEAAYFNSAARLAAVVALLPAIQVTYLAPRFAALHHHGDTHSLNLLAQRSTRRAAACAGLLGSLLAVFPAQALRVFGEQYIAAAGSLRLLALSSVVVVALGPVNALMLIAGLERRASLFSALALGLALISLVLLGPAYGSLGASVVMSIVSISYATAATITLQRKAHIFGQALGPNGRPGRGLHLTGASGEGRSQ